MVNTFLLCKEYFSAELTIIFWIIIVLITINNDNGKRNDMKNQML